MLLCLDSQAIADYDYELASEFLFFTVHCRKKEKKTFFNLHKTYVNKQKKQLKQADVTKQAGSE